MRYLQLHPHSADSIAGIEQWWLAPLRARSTDVQLALDELVAAGQLVRACLVDGSVIYQAATSKPQG